MTYVLRSRLFSSRSIPSRIRSSRASPSTKAASIRSTVSSSRGRVSRIGQSFLRPMGLFRTYVIDDRSNISYIRNISKGLHMTRRITFNKPPSVSRVVDALCQWHNRDRNGLSPEQAHKIAAVMAAADHALARSALPHNKWRGHRHHAAKCREHLPEVCAHPSYRGHNNPPIVDIEFR